LVEFRAEGELAMSVKRVVVIMAGGSGERFYPLSRVKRPKQLLPLVSPDKILIEEAIERITPLIPIQDVYIITSKILQPIIRNVLPHFPPANVIAEPYKRNTAPCLALAAAIVCSKYQKDYSPEQISIAVLTADQYIGDADTFRQQVGDALHFAERRNELVTLGITPSRPETGYGYVEVGNPIDGEIKSVKRFCEKPDAATASQFLAAGNYLWNSGMFFYRCDTFIEGMKEHCPEIGSAIESLSISVVSEAFSATDGSYASIDATFAAFPDVSIDYALMEKASNVAVLPSRFSWDDVGSWDSLDRTNPHDESGNVSVGQTTIVNSHNSIIANYSTNSSMMISAVGLDNVVIIVTDDSIVVVPKDKVQDVKKVVASLRERKLDSFL
jgi:mannose-1-phosphate guanylyltransferase